MVRRCISRASPDKEWDDKVESALEAVSLNPADVLNKFPHQLSGGQQQRLLVARALLLEVKLLVADEIISMLDASTRVDVLNMLVDLKSAGLGILFITHDLSLGNYISDKTVILRDGVVVEMGDTQKVFGNPQHSYTQSLLTAVPQLHRKWDLLTSPHWSSARSANGTTTARPAIRRQGRQRSWRRTRTEELDAQLGEGELASAETERFSKSWAGLHSGAKTLSDEPPPALAPASWTSPTTVGASRLATQESRAEALLLASRHPNWWSASRAISWQSRTSH